MHEIRRLLNAGADVDMPIRYSDVDFTAQDRPIHMVTHIKRLDLVLLLADYGATLDIENVEGWTATHVAAIEGAVPILDYLLFHGCNANKVAHDFG